MRTLLLLSALLISNILISQIKESEIKAVFAKHDQGDYKEAIKGYNKFVKKDPLNFEWYYNRGLCYSATNQLNKAFNDYCKTIEIQPNNSFGYYRRASTLYEMGAIKESFPDIQKSIELNPEYSNAYIIRGLYYESQQDKVKACSDYSYAKKLGHTKADKFYSSYCGNEQLNGESFMLHWPEEENWKIANQIEKEEITVMELIRAHESINNWTEYACMIVLHLPTTLPLDSLMLIFADKATAASPKTRLQKIEMDTTTINPWILFALHSPASKKMKQPESQLYYITKGTNAYFVTFRAVKQEELTEEQIKKWSEFFKSGQVIIQEPEK